MSKGPDDVIWNPDENPCCLPGFWDRLGWSLRWYTGDDDRDCPCRHDCKCLCRKCGCVTTEEKQVTPTHSVVM
jgi:hypothetical protein